MFCQEGGQSPDVRREEDEEEAVAAADHNVDRSAAVAGGQLTDVATAKFCCRFFFIER